jgi:hypothetical protein
MQLARGNEDLKRPTMQLANEDLKRPTAPALV